MAGAYVLLVVSIYSCIGEAMHSMGSSGWVCSDSVLVNNIFLYIPDFEEPNKD